MGWVSLLLLFTSRPLSLSFHINAELWVTQNQTTIHSSSFRKDLGSWLPINAHHYCGQDSRWTQKPHRSPSTLASQSLSSTLTPRSDTNFNCNSSILFSNHHHFLCQFSTSGTPTSLRPTSGIAVRPASHWSYHFLLSLYLPTSSLNSLTSLNSSQLLWQLPFWVRKEYTLNHLPLSCGPAYLVKLQPG